MILTKRDRFYLPGGIVPPQPGVDINPFLDHRYRAENSFNESGTIIKNNEAVQVIRDEIGGQHLNWSLSLQNGVTPLHLTGEKPRYRSILKGVQIHNETGPRYVTSGRLGEKAFPRYTFLVGYQAKYNTYEANWNPYNGQYLGDFGDNATRYSVGSSLGKGFPIRQMYILEIVERIVGGQTVVEEWFNGVKTNGTANGISQEIQGNPVHQIGADTNNPNWAFVDRGIKYGSIPDDSTRTIIRNSLVSKYGSGRVNLPLAENLSIGKSGSVHGLSYNYNHPNGIAENVGSRLIKWILWTGGAVQSTIYFPICR